MNSIFILLLLFGCLNIAKTDKREIEVDEVNCAKVRVELVFVIDASSSLTAVDFANEKTFVADMAGSFDIGQDKSRVGLVTFADAPEIVFGFTKYNSTTDTVKAINDMKQLTGITALGAAIKLAGEGILKDARAGLQKYIIVLTDGQNNRWPAPKLVTPALKEGGTIFIAMGVGSEINVDELHGISSSNSIFRVADFSSLSGFVAGIRKNICTVKVKFQYSTCETEGDISFIIDPTHRGYLASQISLLKELFTRLEISPQRQRVALVVDGVGTVVGLDKYTNRDDYINYLTTADLDIPDKGKSGLVATDQVLTSSRMEVPKLAVLMRAHTSLNHDGDVKAALTLRNRGSTVLTIALGPNVNESNLNDLSSTKKTIHPTTSAWDQSYISEISENLCQNLKKVYKECSGKKLDLVFVLDSSSSVGPDNWLMQSQFVNRIVSMLDVGNSTTQLGAVYFNSEAYLGFELGKYNNKKENIDALLNLPYSEGATAIGNALKLAQQQLSVTKRKDAVSVIVLVTDGKSNVGLKPETVATSIKNEGTHIICIGITDMISKDQLQKLSSTNEVYEINDFDSLEKFAVESLTKEACQAIKNVRVQCPSPNMPRSIEL